MGIFKKKIPETSMKIANFEDIIDRLGIISAELQRIDARQDAIDQKFVSLRGLVNKKLDYPQETDGYDKKNDDFLNKDPFSPRW